MKVPSVSLEGISHIDMIALSFEVSHALQVKAIEKVTNHDVKAVEYFIKKHLEGFSETAGLKEFVHFCCTSEDINNLAYARMLKDSILNVILPQMVNFMSSLSNLAQSSASIPLLALTHGQAATPTTFGREIAVFVSRLARQIENLRGAQFMGKFNGATGSFNAHMVAYPDIDWPAIAREFVEEHIGVTYQPVSTQIECHDYIGETSDTMSRISTILIGFSRDMWTYISRHILKLRVVAGEVGSSTMPHKVNPIDFENAEGNLGVAVALFNHFSSKLLISRMQRDLSDSTVLRNLGLAFGHFMIAIDSLAKGLGKVEVDTVTCASELERNYSLLAEPVQTVMRRYGLANPYERLKELTRGTEITKESMHAFIASLELPKEEIEKLEKLTPQTYIGLAESIAREYGKYH
jgi:adenylosuccinate lyase